MVGHHSSNANDTRAQVQCRTAMVWAWLSAAALTRAGPGLAQMGDDGHVSRFVSVSVGQELLPFALHLALRFSGRVGLYAVIVDAKDERAAAFYRKLGFEATLDDALRLFVPVASTRCG
jgi:hypothetical protein